MQEESPVPSRGVAFPPYTAVGGGRGGVRRWRRHVLDSGRGGGSVMYNSTARSRITCMLQNHTLHRAGDCGALTLVESQRNGGHNCVLRRDCQWLIGATLQSKNTFKPTSCGFRDHACLVHEHWQHSQQQPGREKPLAVLCAMLSVTRDVQQARSRSRLQAEHGPLSTTTFFKNLQIVFQMSCRA